MSSRLEEILNATVNGETIEFTPQSRMERYLKACVNKSGTDGLPQPVSRSDALFYKLAEKMPTMGGGGSGSSDLIDCDELPTEGVQEGKIYRAPGVITEDVTEGYTMYVNEGDGSVSDATDMFIIFETVDDIVGDGWCFVTSENKAYISEDGSILSFEEYAGDPSMHNGLVDSLDEIDPERVGVWVTYNPPGATTVVGECYNIGLNLDKDIRLFEYSDGKPNEMGFLRNLFDVTKSMDYFMDSTSNARLLSMTDISRIVKYNDTRNVVTMKGAFKQCIDLAKVPLLNTKNVTDMMSAFYSCSKLKRLPPFDTSNVTVMSYMLEFCTTLVEVPKLDMRNVTGATKMFDQCRSLSSLWIKNIQTSLQVGSGTDYGHLLTLDSLIHLIGELRNTGTDNVLTVGSANLEKLANVYVRTIDITDEMRTEDDLIDEKLPFEVCESTDEGACLITTYVTFKNWEIQ